MGCAGSCDTDESSATCPVGSITIKHCGGRKVTEEVEKTPEPLAEIKSRVEWELWMAKLRSEKEKEQKED